MNPMMSAKSINALARMAHLYRKYPAAKIMCVLITICLCGIMFSYSKQYDQWMSRVQLLITNVSETVGLSPEDRSLRFTNSSVKVSSSATINTTIGSVIVSSSATINKTNTSGIVSSSATSNKTNTSGIVSSSATSNKTNTSGIVSSIATINKTNSSVIVSSSATINKTNSSGIVSSSATSNTTNITDSKNKLDQKQQLAESQVTENCTFPSIDPLDPVIMALVEYHSPINCSSGVPNLVHLDGDTIKVNHSKITFFGKKNKTFNACRYKSLDRKPGSDFKTVVLNISVWFNDSITLRDSDDNLVVECYDNNKTVLSRSYFTVIHVKKDLETSLEENLKKHIKKTAPKEVLSVLFIGIDGNSKQNFQRLMPKTRKFLLNNLTAIELHKYNTVGGQTYTTILPMLTGTHAAEFDRGNWTANEHYYDAVNDRFLWSDFRKAGYRTGIVFDLTNITAFHYLKPGWNKPPVDYYLRATVLEMEQDKLMKNNGGHCVGDIPAITLNHNLWIQMASTFNNSQSKPYFGFSFSADLTHDDLNKASAGDDLYLSFLQEMRDKNIINNTIIIFFSDHGERFGKIRSTYNGFIESRTPYVFLIFPPWFHRKYPNLIKVLKINQERLTTNFDVYETVQDVLNFQATTGYGNITKRGISLFQEIPPERTCKHADIPITHCLCDSLSREHISSPMSQALVSAVLQKLTHLLIRFWGKCSRLSLKSLENVMVVEPGDRAAKASAKGKSFYQITMTTTPGDAIFEAKLSYHPSTKVIEVIGDVTRLNMYRGQAECIKNSKLRQYCFCVK